MFVALELLANLFNVSLGLGIGWNPGMAIHGTFPRIISGSNQGDITFEISQ